MYMISYSQSPVFLFIAFNIKLHLLLKSNELKHTLNMTKI